MINYFSRVIDHRVPESILPSSLSSPLERLQRATKSAAIIAKGIVGTPFRDSRIMSEYYWLEAIDPLHRYSQDVDSYFKEWKKSATKYSFFQWLDSNNNIGDNIRQVKYLGKLEREKYRVHFKDGLCFTNKGERVDTQKAYFIYVLSPDHYLYIGQYERGTFHHSSFLAGGAVLSSGSILIDNGVITKITDKSGHYYHDNPYDGDWQIYHILEFLKKNSINLNKIECLLNSHSASEYVPVNWNAAEYLDLNPLAYPNYLGKLSKNAIKQRFEKLNYSFMPYLIRQAVKTTQATVLPYQIFYKESNKHIKSDYLERQDLKRILLKSHEKKLERFPFFKRHIVIIGAPGSGKSSIAQKLMQFHPYEWISAGVILREAAKSSDTSDETIQKIKQAFKERREVEEDLVIQIVFNKLRQAISSSKTVILDGFPRNIKQLEMLNNRFSLKKFYAIHITVDEFLAKKRMSSRRYCNTCLKIYNLYQVISNTISCTNCGGKIVQRQDDLSEDIKKRWFQFQNQDIHTVLREFEQQNILIKLNGNSDFEVVEKQLITEIKIQNSLI